MNATQLAAMLATKRQELHVMFTEHTVTAADGSKTYNFTADDLVEVNKRNDELSELHEQWRVAKGLDDADAANRQALKHLNDPQRFQFGSGSDDRQGDRKSVKTLGQMIVETDAFKARQEGRGSAKSVIEFDVKTLFQTSAGWDPRPQYEDRVILSADRKLRAIDLPSVGETTTDTIKYMAETTATFNAAETAEGSAVPESAFALTEQTELVRRIGTTLPVTQEQLDDVVQVQSYLENRLRHDVTRRLDLQILVGNGTAPNLSGYLDRAGIQTQAKGVDSEFDAIFKAITKVRFTGEAEPDAVVLHPNDYQVIVLAKDAEGRYIWGDPAINPNKGLWGLPVVVTSAITENTGLTGAFREFSQAFFRQGVEIEFTDSDADDFTKFRTRFRSSVRAALAVYREAAYCSVTGI